MKPQFLYTPQTNSLRVQASVPMVSVEPAVCLQPNNKLHEVSHLLTEARWVSVGRWITLTDKSKVPLILTRWIIWKIEEKKKKKTKIRSSVVCLWVKTMTLFVQIGELKCFTKMPNVYKLLHLYLCFKNRYRPIRSINYPLTIPWNNLASIYKVTDIWRHISFLLHLKLALYHEIILINTI